MPEMPQNKRFQRNYTKETTEMQDGIPTTSVPMNPIKKAQVRYRELKSKGGVPSIEEKFKEHPTPLKAIRLMCIDFCGGNRKAPKLCTVSNCPLFLFRNGKKPKNKKTSETAL
jgi:hypothetical protein